MTKTDNDRVKNIIINSIAAQRGPVSEHMLFSNLITIR